MVVNFCGIPCQLNEALCFWLPSSLYSFRHSFQILLSSDQKEIQCLVIRIDRVEVNKNLTAHTGLAAQQKRLPNHALQDLDSALREGAYHKSWLSVLFGIVATYLRCVSLINGVL